MARFDCFPSLQGLSYLRAIRSVRTGSPRLQGERLLPLPRTGTPALLAVKLCPLQTPIQSFGALAFTARLRPSIGKARYHLGGVHCSNSKIKGWVAIIKNLWFVSPSLPKVKPVGPWLSRQSCGHLRLAHSPPVACRLLASQSTPIERPCQT